MTQRTAVLLSGGLDSTTLVAYLQDLGHTVEAVSVDYGQRHDKELVCAEAIARYYGIPWHLLPMRQVGKLLAGSALTDDGVPVPDGHYREDSMRATVVPSRNLIMLALAAGVAQARKLDAVAIGAHGGDHWIYPDCRPRFLDAAGEAIYMGTEGFGPDGAGIVLLRPFARMDKAEVVAHAVRLGAPTQLTWSCYKGGGIACGRCGTCWERLEAFDLAGASDPIPYLDHTFWKGGA